VQKYQETARDRKRRTIMIRTTNNDQFLSDTTGNRRILPIDVGATGHIELARIARDALQLWAEGREIFLKFGVQYSEAESLATTRHKEHMVDEVIAEPVDKWLRERNVSAGYPEDGKVTTKAIAWGALGIPPVRVSPLDKKKIQAAMTSLGYENVKQYENGRLLWVW
jgi:predicted P-loop ATPase